MTATKSAPKKPAPKEASNRPVHEVRLGHIRAADWANMWIYEHGSGNGGDGK